MDPQAAAVMRLIEEELAAAGRVEGIEAQRVVNRALIDKLSIAHRHRFEGKISDAVVQHGEVDTVVRRYVPRDAREGEGLAYFHGGGWVFGDLDTGDRFARSLARALRVTVVSVHYRRAPEHPFPAALEDCVAVAETLRAEFSRWFGVAGDSAGGNLALSTCLSMTPNPPDAQILLYPCTDASMSHESYETYSEGPGLTRDLMRYYWDAYAGGHTITDPLLSPGVLGDHSNFPPTVLACAGIDVLHDEVQALAEGLASSGVSGVFLPFPDLPHGFVDLVDQVDAAERAIDQVLSAVQAIRSGAAARAADPTQPRLSQDAVTDLPVSPEDTFH